jgi:hypothetical protein
MAPGESGGIGRRAGLRSRCLRTWGFESPLSHAVMSRDIPDGCRGAQWAPATPVLRLTVTTRIQRQLPQKLTVFVEQSDLASHHQQDPPGPFYGSSDSGSEPQPLLICPFCRQLYQLFLEVEQWFFTVWFRMGPDPVRP